jgi:hypothetical protein
MHGDAWRHACVHVCYSMAGTPTDRWTPPTGGRQVGTPVGAVLLQAQGNVDTEGPSTTNNAALYAACSISPLLQHPPFF